MSNWLSDLSSENQQDFEELNSKGLQHPDTRPNEPSAFDGAISSPFRGAAIGLNKVGDALSAPIDAVVDRVSYSLKDVSTNEFIEPYEEYKAKREKARDNLVYGTIDKLEDKENTGVVGRFGVGAGDYLFRGALGAATGGTLGAATLTGGSTGNYIYTDLTRKGVDQNTALQVAGVNAVGDAIGTALPMSYGFRGTGGLLGDAALSVGGATVLNTGVQYTSNQILKAAGNEKEAKQFEVTGESVATDLALNALLFGGARYLGSRQNQLDQDIDTEINQLNAADIETRNDQINDTLVRNSFEFEDTTLPVRTTDPVQQNNHYKNLDAATDQILKGQTVNVTNAVVRGNIDIAPSEFKTIRYDDPRLDAVLETKASSMNMSWAIPLLQAIRKGGERSHNWQVSPKGAKSIMQIMPDTQKGLERNSGKKFDINNPSDATEMALLLVKEISDTYKTKDPKVIAAHYNGGFKNGKAMQNTGKPVSDETIKYVNNISNYLQNNNRSVAYGMDGSSYDFAYEVKDWADLIASNDRLYGVNPLYPSELQPRDRTREASRQQIERMADDLKPELLGESYKLSDGAPIIGPDNVVESGNGRTLAIGRAYENGRAEAYRDFIKTWATERGMDISGLNQPVLVRTRLSDVDRVAFSRLANESDVAQFSATERALSDADRLPDSTLLKINSDGAINIDGSMDYIRSFVDQLPQSERGSVITGDGRLSQEGKRRIESAIVQRAYGDSNLVTRLSENLDDDSKNVLNALLRAAPQLSQLNDLVKQGGRFENSISKDLAQAAQKLSDIKANGQQVRDYLDQGQLIDDGLSDGARRFLEVFDNNRKSAKAIGESINTEIQSVENMGDPRQGSLFGETPEEQAALDVIFSNPDQPIAVSRINSMGEPEEFTMTLRDYHAELEAEIKQSEQDILAAQTALNCALQFGAA